MSLDILLVPFPRLQCIVTGVFPTRRAVAEHINSIEPAFREVCHACEPGTTITAVIRQVSVRRMHLQSAPRGGLTLTAGRVASGACQRHADRVEAGCS